MKRIHPNLGLAALALSAALTGMCGCGRTQTAGIANPFLAPDRVAPPSTRVQPPGTAQPYYPGDPLPVMQSAAPATVPDVVAAAAPSPSAADMSVSPPTPMKIAFSNERAVGIPNDDDALRFALPDPPEPEPTQIASAQDSVPVQPTNPGVVPAIYSASPTGWPVAPGTLPNSATETEPGSPWRSPQISTAPAPATAAPTAQPYMPQPFPVPPLTSPLYTQAPVPPGYVAVPPTVGAPPNVDVTLRPVASPPTPVEPSTPRIRLPGYPAPPITFTAAPPTASTPSGDGFRPRSSMR